MVMSASTDNVGSLAISKDGGENTISYGNIINFGVNRL